MHKLKFVFKSQPYIVTFGNNGMVIYKASDFENIKTVNIAGDFNSWNIITTKLISFITLHQIYKNSQTQ